MSYTYLFSCTGEANTNNCILINIGTMENNDIKDSCIGSFTMSTSNTECYIYASNIDLEYMSDSSRNSKIPMIRIFIWKLCPGACFKLAEVSSWFFPNDVNDIKLTLNNNKYDTIKIPGRFKLRVITWNDTQNDLSTIKDITWINCPDVYPESNMAYLEFIKTHKQIINIVDHEWKLVKKSIDETLQYSMKIPNNASVGFKNQKD
jgi:hypothetical protein